MRSLEIFSGCGGLAKGLELAGFEHAKFVEFNSHACRTLRLNFDSDKVYEGDIQNYDFGELGDIDIVAGGPPCQPFSLGGKHRAHDDKRDMFPQAIRAIENLHPKAFIFENVKGLLRSTFKDYFDYIILRLRYPNCSQSESESWFDHSLRLKKIKKSDYDGVYYDVKFKLLNAADYGVPQKRERVVIVGIRNDLNKEWHYPDATHSEDRLLWEQYVTHTYWQRHGIKFKANAKQDSIGDSLREKYGIFEPEGFARNTVRDALKEVPDIMSKHGIPDHIFKDGARTYAGHTGSDIDEPSKTLKAGGHGVPGGENMIRFADGTVRYFSTYESKLLQTFPCDFNITGAWGESMRQIGNAVPVKLAHVLGQHMYKLLAS